MWREFFSFELRHQLRQPLLWIAAVVMALMAFGASSSDAIQIGGAIGNVNRNAPVVIVQFLAAFTLLSMLIVAMFIAGAVLRDHEIGIADMLFATPMRKRDYLFGRFAAGYVACLAIYVVIAVGLMLGPLMPWVDTARVGRFSLWPYLWGFGVIVLPDLLFTGALLLLLAATTRKMMLVYVGVLGFLVLWTIAGVLTREVQRDWLAVLLDPLGIRALGRMTRYFSVSESNTILPPLSGFLLANRLLWCGLSLLMLAATLMLFKPQREGSGRALFGRRKALPSAPSTAPIVLPRRHAPAFNSATVWRQCWQVLCLDASAVFRSLPFLVMLLFGVMNFIASATLGGERFGTSVYPVTRLMLQSLNSSFTFMLVIVVMFYAGELIFRERQAHIADVVDALPIPDWVPLVAKSLALVGVVLTFLLAGDLAAMAFQLLRGGVAIEPLLYLKGTLLEAHSFILMGCVALAFQVFTNNKFVGYFAIIALLVAQGVLGMLHFDHNLYKLAGTPAAPYSDMNGYGHFLTGWFWFSLYWSWFVLALLILAQAFSVRGLAPLWRTRVALAAQRLHGAAGLALAALVLAFIGTGSWIFYNTNILNDYVAGDTAMDRQADYEKRYQLFQNLPHPKLTDVRADVAIYPAERRVFIDAHYRLQNKTALPLDTLRINVNPEVQTRWLDLPPHQITTDDAKLGWQVIKLAQPIGAGAALDLHFTVDVAHPGFTNAGTPDSINLNGTFFNNAEYFPQFGYAKRKELNDRNERRKRGLGEPQRMAKLEDESARQRTVFGSEAGWINFETTVSTSADQIALAPGYLQKSWEKDGRRYFQYRMDRPMVPFFAYLSARWEVKKAYWHDIPIEIYYDKKHPYNVDRMIAASQKALDYFNAEFTPYQHHQLRIIEFPGYQAFAQSFANTVPYSEGIGFIADLRKADDIDYVSYITAHEVAHQWWGHQVSGADMQGETMLVESLAQYSALMVMEKAYGREHLRRFFKYELDSYLRSRGGEKIEELPLARVENQPYIHYRKGSLILYRLRDEIGEVALNRALKKFLQAKAYQQPPYTNTTELLQAIRAESPTDKQALITDMFEKIVFYDNRMTSASAKQRADGQWDVTLQLHIAKFDADGKGKETARVYDEPVEIAVFARAAGAAEKAERTLFRERRVLSGSDPVVTVTVAEKPFDAGVDPYNKLIDRNSSDNRKEITF